MAPLVPTHTVVAPAVPTTHTDVALDVPTHIVGGIMKRDTAPTGAASTTVEGMYATDLFIDSMRDGAGGTRLPVFASGKREKGCAVLCINFFRGVATAEEREILMSTQL